MFCEFLGLIVSLLEQFDTPKQEAGPGLAIAHYRTNPIPTIKQEACGNTSSCTARCPSTLETHQPWNIRFACKRHLTEAAKRFGCQNNVGLGLRGGRPADDLMQLGDGFLDAFLSELLGAQPAHAALADIRIGNLRWLKKQRPEIKLKRSKVY
jgi:hypothetical protein